jgi:hypothetical protein
MHRAAGGQQARTGGTGHLLSTLFLLMGVLYDRLGHSPRQSKKGRRLMIVEVSGGRARRCQPGGLEEGLKTRCECG